MLEGVCVCVCGGGGGGTLDIQLGWTLDPFKCFWLVGFNLLLFAICDFF